METPTRTDPPYVPLRHGRWPVHKTPRWVLAGLALVALGAVLVGLAHKPTQGQRATDMNSFLKTMTTDIESCAGGVKESLYVLHEIETGAKSDVTTAIVVARTGASNCSPANNSQLDGLLQYQVRESLAGFHLERAVNGLGTWAFPDAMHVQADVASILAAHGSARTAATAKLQKDLARLNGQRAYVDKIMMNAVKGTSATTKLPTLPG